MAEKLLVSIAGAIILAIHPCTGTAQPFDNQQLLQNMQETIQQQQKQLALQAEQLKQQAQKLETLQQQLTTLQQGASPRRPTTSPVAPNSAEVKASALPVTSGTNKLQLAISGQINRALNIANDGRSTQLYHVDNDTSNSRIRLVGTAGINGDLTLGTRIEVAVAPDESSKVSQSNQAPGDYFNQRWTELSLTSVRYGKLSLGKGDTASNTTAEADLSKTDVVQYSSVADIASGMLFRERQGAHQLTALKISDAFKSGDGLSRLSRLRYDTPTLYGFRLAGSVATNQQSDMALFWGGAGYGFKASGAFAVANPKLAASDLLYDGSLSLLHTASGLNLTVSGALLDHLRTNDRTNLYIKLGWIANLTSQGYTAFGADYTRSRHVAAEGDKGYSLGAAVVQSFERLATELYLQYRIYSLDRANGTPVADMRVGTFGARVKF